MCVSILNINCYCIANLTYPLLYNLYVFFRRRYFLIGNNKAVYCISADLWFNIVIKLILFYCIVNLIAGNIIKFVLLIKSKFPGRNISLVRLLYSLSFKNLITFFKAYFYRITYITRGSRIKLPILCNLYFFLFYIGNNKTVVHVTASLSNIAINRFFFYIIIYNCPIRIYPRNRLKISSPVIRS